MPAATQVITSFLGGEISQVAQGRYDRPDYRTSMRTCLNSFPAEIGAWTRRPGSQNAGTTRRGVSGRVMRFDLSQAAPITLELSDGWMRFRSGPALVRTNDLVGVVSISSANPAVVQVSAAVTWASGDTLVFPGASTPLLENRQFVTAKIDATHFDLRDPLTGAGIDGSTLGALPVGATVGRVQELATPYAGGSWANVRLVQAETTAILLAGASAPRALTVTPPSPSVGANPTFTLNPAVFNDGPYLDPFTNGVQVTPSAQTGIVSLALSFPAYSATKAYAAGAFVTTGGVNYISLLDQNVNNAPASGAPWWQSTSINAAINNGQGFLGSDIGRLVRLFSEPAAWLVGSTYTTSSVVSYNPSGLPGATLYYQSLVNSNTGNIPGADLNNWKIIPQGAALWSWGKITGLSTTIDRALAGSVAIGDMINGGGLGAAFDGVFAQSASASAEKVTLGGFTSGGVILTQSSFVGKNYTASVGAGQKIQAATVYPSSDGGFASGGYTDTGGTGFTFTTSIQLNLRGKATAPVSPADGTLLATNAIANTLSPVTLISNDHTTVWAYVWIEAIGQFPLFSPAANSYTLINSIAEVSFFSPTGTGTSTGVNMEILGPALPYATTISTWRLGVYSDTTGWPTCGTYNDGRLYLGGAVGNRFDASVANGIDGGTINFAPTDQYGTVSAANAISYTFNSKGVNEILWMDPDLQGIKMGTQAGEWLVQAPTAGPISPINITARNVTNHGGAFIEPCRTEHTTIFVQRFAKKLLEYFPDVYSGKFSAPNLADKASHIVKNKVAELAYTSAMTPIIWGRDALGALFGITYKRDSLASAQPPTFYAWHPHALGSGRTVESICGGPSVGGDLDALTMVTNDATTNIRHVEILTDVPDEDADLASIWHLDNAVNPTSATSNLAPVAGAPRGGATFNGLWHLNGETVQVFAAGLDCGDQGDLDPAISDYVVSNGSVFVPFGDGVSAGAGAGLFTSDYFDALDLTQVVIGFTYNSDGQMVRLIAQADTGARNGPALGAPSRTHRASIKLVNAKGLSIGGTFDALYPCLFKMNGASATDLDALSTFSGIFYDQVDSDFSYEDSLCWRVSRPFPCTITAAAQNLRTEDM